MQPATHGYLNAGDYSVELKATADNGCADSLTGTVIVSQIPNNTIGLYAGYAIFCEGDSCELSVPYNENYIYQWKFDDFNLSGATNYRLKVSKSGNYSVTIVNPVGNCSTESEKMPVTAMVLNSRASVYIRRGRGTIL